MEETALQKALRQWVVTSSKLDDDAVIWSEQDAVRLPFPYLTMRLGDLIPVHQDEVTTETDLDAPAGKEITETVIGRRSATLTIQCFGDGDTETTRQILSRVQTSLGLTSVGEKLQAAGLSVFDPGQVQNISVLRETAFEPRSLLEVRCYLSETVSEQYTFIETVQITNEVTGQVFTVDLDL